MRYKTALVILLLAFLGGGLSLLPPGEAADKPAEKDLVDQVAHAIERGIQFLKDQEKGSGSWEGSDQQSLSHPGGWTSLAMLALLNSGVKPDDPIIERGLKYLRQVDSTQTYVVALQTMVFAEARPDVDLQRIQRNVEWLINARIMNGNRCKGWTYQVPQNGNLDGDNSNTQYALLGLHAGQQAGVKIKKEVWQSIQNYYLKAQQPDHGWNYTLSRPGMPSSLTMTTAGVSGLLISGMELNPGRETPAGDGSYNKCGEYEKNDPLTKGLGWIGSNFRIQMPINTYYNIYGIERVGRLSGQRFLGEHDWYRVGCKFLIREQHEDGSWYTKAQFDDWPIVSTSFALLFLSKGRTPILISKFAHGQGEDWNKDRNDARNLTEYARTQVFRRLPLGWQVFDTRHLELSTPDKITDVVRELLQSPIVYISGHLAPDLRGAQGEILKQYVEQGGFILAEACCGRQEFADGFRKQMKELFPDNALKELAAEHPIWTAHASVPPGSFGLEGIEYGCKTVVVFSPQDLSCLWEANQYEPNAERGQLAFRMGGNIVAYATGMEPPQPRLTRMEVIQESGSEKIRRGTLKVAQLRHEGDWQPAPKAMRNLMAHIRTKFQLDVDLKTRAIFATDKDLEDYKFLYMHGRREFSYSADAVRNLRKLLETGGLLFADACCGKKPFDGSFRELAGKLFPDKRLEPIPLSDDLYSQDVNGAEIKTVRCRTQAAGDGGQSGDFRDMAPQLEGIKLQNRWVVIYSKYDIGCALEKHQSTDCLGHDHASALKLASAAIFYALKR